MNKGFLLKVFFLMIALAAVVTMLIAAARTDFSSAAAGWSRPKTYFEQFFIVGGPVVWFVLLPMSVITVYLATEYCLTIRRKKLLPNDISGTITAVMQQVGFAQLPSRIADRSDFISVAVTRAVAQSGGDLGRIRSLIVESLQEQALALLRKIEWANIIGNVSPMVGLFGTVLGIIKMFNAMAAVGGQPHPSQLAGGISIALVTTFWGLMIAIPALTVHGVFQNRIEILASEAAGQAEKLLSQMAHILREQRRAEQPKAAHSASSGQAQSITEIPSKRGGTIQTRVPPS
jgi:biopolymer transport protein ExbB